MKRLVPLHTKRIKIKKQLQNENVGLNPKVAYMRCVSTKHKQNVDSFIYITT